MAALQAAIGCTEQAALQAASALQQEREAWQAPPPATQAVVSALMVELTEAYR